MKKRVADILFDTLAERGIRDCFAVVGGGAMHLDNALAISTQIKTTFNHHEQACAMAAEAYARYSGKMAAVCVTSGPGATNTLTGVMGAWVDSIPLIVISGNVRYETSVANSGLPLRYRGIQEFDIINSIQNMTKYAKVITEPQSIRKEVNKAIDTALNGRPGPVWLDIPLDIQNVMVEEESLFADEQAMALVTPSPEEIDKIFFALRNAKRPCILPGSGITSSHTQKEFELFTSAMSVPIVGGAWLGDIFYSENKNYYGLSGNVGPRTGNFILQNADLILALGNSLSFKQTGYDLESFAPKAKIIMVDIDKNECLKIKDKVDTFVHADLRAFFCLANERERNITPPTEWTAYCTRLREHFSPYESCEGIHSEERVNKYYFWKRFNEVMPKDTLVALGNSSVAMGINQIGKRCKEQRFISNYICGSMGYDLPAAIGVSTASNREVICVTGDGSFMMNLQELQTIQYNALPIKIILFENEGYGNIKQTFKNFYNGKEIGCSPENGISFPSFKGIADTFGFAYRCCASNQEVADTLDWLCKASAPLIVEVKQQLDDPVLPKLMSKLKEDGKMTAPVLQNMFPFISEEDMKWVMLD